MLICSTLEYITSVLLEIAFNTRWWDYSNDFLNLNGRICIETTVLFGILGTLIIYVVNPFFVNLLDKLSNKTINVLCCLLIFIFIADIALSLTSIILIRDSFGENIKDTTEEVSKRALKFIKGIAINIKEAII